VATGTINCAFICLVRPMGTPRLGLLLSLVATSTGCLGPQAVRQTRLQYNEAYRKTSEEQILLNIVRLRYADSPQFIDLPSITSQFEASGRASYLGGRDGAGPGTSSLGSGELLFHDAPTLSYQPKQGKQFGRSLAKPLTTELIRLVLGTTNFTPFLLMAVNDANDIANAPQATLLIPDKPADNEEFRELLGLLAALYQRDGVELAIETIEVAASDPIPKANVQGDDVILAAKDDFVFRSQADERLTLKQRRKSLALRFRPREIDSYEVQELSRRLRLTPGFPAYRIRSELLDDAEDDYGGLPNALGEDTIFLNMRSTLEIMTFLSKGVCVPPEHVANGEAPVLLDSTGRPFDWSGITRGLFAVRSGCKRPKSAEIAVQYRDQWFWIERSDVASRATLTTIELLLSLQESDDTDSGPLLTLPVGG
jgi:hypothetical protein